MSTPTAWFLSVPTAQKDYLGAIRHWPALNIGVSNGVVWVSGLTPTQLASVTVQTIPYKTVYYSDGDTLFRQGSLLPERPVPTLLWSPIERGIPVTLPVFRGNYVDDQGFISLNVVPSEDGQETTALLVGLADLALYVKTAPAIRLQALRWALLDTDRALLVGTPVLPVPGDGLWQRGDFLLPAGYDFDLFILADLVHQTLSPQGRNWIVWQADSAYFLVPKSSVQPLSLGSFRASLTS